MTRSSIRSRPQSLLAKPYLLAEVRWRRGPVVPLIARLQKVGSLELPPPLHPDDPRIKDGWRLLGHEHAFPRPRLNVRCRFSRGTFADAGQRASNCVHSAKLARGLIAETRTGFQPWQGPPLTEPASSLSMLRAESRPFRCASHQLNTTRVMDPFSREQRRQA